MSISNGTITAIGAGVAAAITASGAESLYVVAGGLTAAVLWVLGQEISDAVKDGRQRREDQRVGGERERAWAESRAMPRPVADSEYSNLF
ncbi:hypothetical protein [Aeromicrobium sp. 179-A 4D2 NHS]|uniref:hypothetical protein n=1 Tax=Aeromicrobium sp. 179-A 4D2 NHS TaxID=3142375 RepID=UPI00399F690C